MLALQSDTSNSELLELHVFSPERNCSAPHWIPRMCWLNFATDSFYLIHLFQQSQHLLYISFKLFSSSKGSCDTIRIPSGMN